MAKRRWLREDALLVLDLFFNARDVPEKVQKTAQLIGCSRRDIMVKLGEFDYLKKQSTTVKRLNANPSLEEDLEVVPVVAMVCRDVWREFGSYYTYERKTLQKEVRAITKLRRSPDSVSRREVRQMAMRVLFAAQAQGASAADALLSIKSGEETARGRALLDDSLMLAVMGMFDSAQEGIIKEVEEAAGRTSESLSSVERAIIFSAAAEMRAMPETKRRFIINEAVEIAKIFGAEGGHKIVNAVLDKIPTSEHA